MTNLAGRSCRTLHLLSHQVASALLSAMDREYDAQVVVIGVIVIVISSTTRRCSTNIPRARVHLASLGIGRYGKL